MGALEPGSASSLVSWTQGAPCSELDAGSPLLVNWTQGAPSWGAGCREPTSSHHQSHSQLGVVFTLATSLFFLELFLH